MSEHDDEVETLSQRELRNQSGRVLRAVAGGESFVLTNSGVPVGRLVPLDHEQSGLTITRPARRGGGWAQIAERRVNRARPLAEILDELREDRL